ncbi:MAG: CPBP family intramembrane metalloprotease [Lachnospiraceae bacterium]|nr:CPBP family intramembrane metalloprotease [Lachnospiraceae bacterium]
MKTGTRISYLAFVLVTFIMSIVVQVVAALLITLPAGFVVGVQAAMQGITDTATLNQMTLEMTNRIMPVTIVVTHVLLLITFGLWYYFKCVKPQKSALKKISFKEVFTLRNILVMIMIAGGMCFFTNFAMPIASMVIPETVMAEYEALMESAGFGESLLPTIAAVLIAPFGEEFIFRGVTFYYAGKAVSDLQDRRKAFWIANCIQALAFGIFHMNLVQGTYAFIMGLALGYLAHRFGTILPAMLGHMIINGLSSFAWEPVANLLPESYVVYGIGAVVSLAIVFAGLYLGGPADKEAAIN